MKKHIPNTLTTLRVLMIPFLLFLFWNDEWTSSLFDRFLLCFVLYLLAAITDFFDGFFARRWQVSSKYGAFTDSLADKGLTLTVFFSFSFLSPEAFWMPFWLVVLMTVRELGLTFLRIYALRKKTELKTERQGKIKTFFQMATQVLAWLVLIFYAYYVDKLGFNTSLSLQENPFALLNETLKNQGAILASISISLRLLVGLMFGLSMYLTLASGIMYLKINRHLFRKDTV